MKKKVDYTDVKKAIMWCAILIGIFVGMYFIIPSMARAGDDTWVINAEAGIIYDSITYEHYMGGSSSADSSGKICDSCTGYSTVLTVSDSLFHFYYLYFYPQGDTNKGSWAWFKQPSDTAGIPTSIVFPLRAYWPFVADSAGLRSGSYDGTALQDANIVNPSASYRVGYSDNYTINTDYWHNYTIDIYQPGVDSLLNWSFQVQPSAIATAGIQLPSSDDLVTVYGWLRTVGNDPIKGAVIQATRRSNGWSVAGSGPPVIIPQIVGWTETDTLGLFQLMLRNTGSYSDTSKGFYDIIGVQGTNTLFKIEKLYLPDVDSLSIADSLSGRE